MTLSQVSPQPSPRPTDRAISRREVALLVGAAFWLAADQLIRIAADPFHLIAGDLGDPLAQAWQIAWGGQALLNHPLAYWDSNQFWPLPDSLAFSDALVGYAPLGMLGSGPEAAVLRYNLAFLVSWALPCIGTYLLARELKLRPGAAAISAAAFAYAPWRVGHMGHLHVLSSGGVPLACFLLLRGYRTGSARMVVAGWAVLAWQVSIGFTYGVPILYLTLACGAVAMIIPSLRSFILATRHTIAATAIGAVIVVTTGVVLSLPYQRVLARLPEATRPAVVIERWSPPVRSFVTASDRNLIWSGATEWGRRGMGSSESEKSLFPGLMIVLLAAFGLAKGPWPVRFRWALGLGVTLFALFSLGFRGSGLGQWLPYRFLYEFLPGWEGLRTAGRLNMFTSLGLAILAGGGAASLVARISSRWGEGRSHVACSVALACVVIEGTALGVGVARVAPEPDGFATAPQPALHLPYSTGANRKYLLWSTRGFPKMTNGQSSVAPRYQLELLHRLDRLGAKKGLEELRSRGFTSVVIHSAVDRYFNSRAGDRFMNAVRRGEGGPFAAAEQQFGSRLVVYRLTGHPARRSTR